MGTKRPKVLAVADYYLPGFRGGGPIRSLANMRRTLHDHIDLDLFTRDRDLGMAEAYPGIEVNRWLANTDGRLYYADPQHFGPRGLRAAITEGDYDILYLNSFFSPRGSVLLNATVRKGTNPPRIIVAPRGEFSLGALSLKRKKKRIFIELAKAAGLYRNVYWHVSTSAEKLDLLRVFPQVESRVYIAADPVESAAENRVHPPKVTGALNLAFISRISPMKNLDGLLQILERVQRQVSLTIYGPIEDHSYWNRCKGLINKLPSNISVTWEGHLDPATVESEFSRYDAFAFPTRGENFGHVIFESLRAGTPVLLSDQTSWREDGSLALRVLALEDTEGWRNAIEAVADRNNIQQTTARAAALAYARAHAQADMGADNTLAMFRAVASRESLLA